MVIFKELLVAKNRVRPESAPLIQTYFEWLLLKSEILVFLEKGLPYKTVEVIWNIEPISKPAVSLEKLYQVFYIVSFLEECIKHCFSHRYRT